MRVRVKAKPGERRKVRVYYEERTCVFVDVVAFSDAEAKRIATLAQPGERTRVVRNRPERIHVCVLSATEERV